MISMPMVYKTATKTVSMALPLPWFKVQPSLKPRLQQVVASIRSAPSQDVLCATNAPSNFTNSSATPPAVTLASGAINNNFDFGLYNLVTIGDSVWHDLDADGVLDSNENGIDGVTIALVQGSTIIETKTTAGGGKYSFSAKPGTYSVQLTLPANFTNSSVTPPAVTLASVESTTTLTSVSLTWPRSAILSGTTWMPTAFKTVTKAVSMG